MKRYASRSFGIVIASLLFIAASGCATSGDAADEQAEEPVEEPAEERSEDDSDRAQAEDGETEHGKDHADHQEKRFKDPEARAEDWNDPERDEWQKPDEVIEAMGVEEGMSVADIGAGTGYFVAFLSEAVGADGRVFASDIEASMREYIDEQADEQGWDNVETVEAEAEDSGLEEDSVDRILLVNTWHHIPNREAYTEHLSERLTDDGEVWVVDYHEDSPSGPPQKHRMTPNEVIDELEAGGLEAEERDLDLERQFVIRARAE